MKSRFAEHCNLFDSMKMSNKNHNKINSQPDGSLKKLEYAGRWNQGSRSEPGPIQSSLQSHIIEPGQSTWYFFCILFWTLYCPLHKVSGTQQTLSTQGKFSKNLSIFLIDIFYTHTFGCVIPLLFNFTNCTLCVHKLMIMFSCLCNSFYFS